jgi:mannitol/fructose-specific phosphotransferase system IIA component (Ntr-type)
VVNKEDHMNALFHLATLLKKPEFIYELKQAQTPQEINRIIMSYEFGLIEGLDNTKKR